MANPYNPRQNYAGYGPSVEPEAESLGLLDTINPLAGMTSDPFLYYYGIRIGAMGHQMSGLLASEKGFARNLKIPIGFRSLTYGGSFDKAKTSILRYEMDYAKGLSGSSLVERNRRLGIDLLGGKPRKGFAKFLGNKPGFKVSPAARGMGFFAGYTVGHAFGLGEPGSIAAGVAGSAAMSSTGGLAKYLYERGNKETARVASELAVQPTTRIGRAFTTLAFGIGPESFTEMGVGASVRKGIYNKIHTYGKEGTLWNFFGGRGVGREVPTAGSFLVSNLKDPKANTAATKKIQDMAYQSIYRKLPDNLKGLEKSEVAAVVRAMESSAPFELLGLSDDSINAVMGREVNDALRQHMFKRQAFPLLGRMLPWRRRALDSSIESAVKKSIREIIDKEARVGFKSVGAQKALDKLASLGIRGDTARAFMSKLQGGPVDLDDLTNYIYEKGEMKQSTDLLKKLSQRKMTRQALVSFAGKAIGAATTASLVVNATTAGLKYSLSAMEAIGGMLSDMRHPDFGSGRYTDTPQATTERQLAFNSIQNALGMGRALMGNEAALVH